MCKKSVFLRMSAASRSLSLSCRRFRDTVPDAWSRKWTICSSMDWHARLAWPAALPSKGFWAFRSASVLDKLPWTIATPKSDGVRGKGKGKARVRATTIRTIHHRPASQPAQIAPVVTMVAVAAAAPASQAIPARHLGADAPASRMDVSPGAPARRAETMAAAGPAGPARLVKPAKAESAPAFLTAVERPAGATGAEAVVAPAAVGKRVTAAHVAVRRHAGAHAVAQDRFASETSAGRTARRWRS